MELRAKYTLFAEGARGSLTKTLIARFGLDADREPQKYGIGLKELWQVAPAKHQPGPGAAHLRLAARQPHRRRLVPLSFRRQPGVGRLRRASQLRESLPLAVRGVPALQDPSADRATPSRAASGSPTARARITEGGWQSVPKLVFPGRRADRLRGGLRQRAAHQGQPQRHAVRHAGGRARRRGARGRAAPTTSSPTTRRPGARPTIGRDLGRCATSSRCGRASAPCSGIALGGLDMWTNTLRLLAVRHARATASPIRRRSSPRRSASRSSIRSPTASSPSTGSPRCSSPTPTTRRTSRCTSRSPTRRLQKASEHDVYGGPSARYCPAGVYEWVGGGRRRRAS